MAPVNPPTYLQASSHSARALRLGTAALLAPHQSGGALVGRSGVKPAPTGSGLYVTQSGTPDKYVQVSAGSAFVAAASTLGGTYECHNDAPYAVRIPDAHASLNRRDLVVARVFDAVDDSGVQNLWDLTVVQGAPASSPNAPAVPSGATDLASVYVPAGSSTVVSGNISDTRKRTVALGGMLPVRNSGEAPVSPYPGMMIWREDLNVAMIANNSGQWKTIHDDNYGFNYGCLAWAKWDCDPNYASTSTTGEVIKYTTGQNARVTFTMPSNVPAGRLVRVETVLNINVSPSGGSSRVWLGHMLDGALVGTERRAAIPNDTFYYEAQTVSLMAPPASGNHTIDTRTKVDVNTVTTRVTSLETAVWVM